MPMGDSALIIQLEPIINLEINNYVHQIAKDLIETPLIGMIELIPAYCTLTVIYNMLEVYKHRKSVCPYETIKFELMRRMLNLPLNKKMKSNLIKIPICYDEIYALDLIELAVHHHLDPNEVIDIHSSPEYHVYMTGFAPGFAFLGGLSDKIATPRRSAPRSKIPAGAVGIGGNQTGIYPIATPGGWNIIAQCPIKLYDFNKTPPILLTAGDTVKFEPISVEKYDHIQAMQI